MTSYAASARCNRPIANAALNYGRSTILAGWKSPKVRPRIRKAGRRRRTCRIQKKTYNRVMGSTNTDISMTRSDRSTTVGWQSYFQAAEPLGPYLA